MAQQHAAAPDRIRDQHNQQNDHRPIKVAPPARRIASRLPDRPSPPESRSQGLHQSRPRMEHFVLLCANYGRRATQAADDRDQSLAAGLDRETKVPCQATVVSAAVGAGSYGDWIRATLSQPDATILQPPHHPPLDLRASSRGAPDSSEAIRPNQPGFGPPNYNVGRRPKARGPSCLLTGVSAATAGSSLTRPTPTPGSLRTPDNNV